jgi:DnaJ-class molecular chaperone
MSYYDILGVAKNATPEDIKRAYRSLANKHHPDKGGDTLKFQEVQTAYDTLSDSGKRQQYDMQQNGMGHGYREFHFHGGMGGHPDLNAIFQQFGFGFAGDPFGRQQQQQRRNKDLRVEIPIPLVTTLEDQTKIISVQTTNGHRETVEVRIPRGVTNGTSIKYPGLGDNLFNTIPRGDLYVQFAVHPAEGFAVNGLDLHTQVRVNCLQAITGGSVNVVGLDGKTFSFNIVPGTQPGAKFRLPQQGLYQMDSIVRGDLYAEVVITVPQNFTDEQLETLRSLIN